MTKNNKEDILCKTTIDETNPEEEIFTYKLGEFAHLTKMTEAKPYLEASKCGLEELSSQIELLYKKLGTVATNCNNRLFERAEAHKREIDELREKIKTLEDSQNDQEQLNNLAENLRKASLKLKETEQLLDEQASEFAEFRKTAESEISLLKSTHKKQLEDIDKKLINTIEQFKQKIEKIENEKAKLEEQLSNRREVEEIIPDETLDIINKHFKEAEKALNTAKSTLVRYSQNDSRQTQPSNQIMQNSSSISTLSNTNNDENNQISIKMSHSLPTFSGKTHENVSDWLFTTSRLIEMCNYTDRKKVILTSAYLKDYALQVYNLHEQSNGDMTWEEFKSFMKSYFTPKNQTELLRNKLSALKQSTTIKEYYVEYRKISNQINDMSETDKIKCFLDGLKSNNSPWVRFHEPKTLEQAFEIADKLEVYNIENPSSNNNSRYLSFHSAEKTNSDTESITLKCKFCGAQGHSIEHCRYKKNSSNRYNNRDYNYQAQNQRNNNTRTQREPVVCCICNKTGHIGENCRTRGFCNQCNTPGHLTYNCPKNTASYMTLSSGSDIEIISWTAKIDGKETIAALDSASHLSIMSHNTAKEWGIEIDETRTSIQTSTGAQSKATGKSKKMIVELEGTIAEVIFTITNIEAYSVLLGLDWFKQTEVILDPKNMAFTLPKLEISTEKIEKRHDYTIDEKHIKTTSKIPIHSAPNKQPQPLNKKLEEEANNLLKANISRSAANWFIIKQKDKKTITKKKQNKSIKAIQFY